VKKLDKKSIHSLLKARSPVSHKGSHGHALLIAGNKGKMGACLIAARACLRSGAGLLSLNVPHEERLILQVGIPEAMVMPREDKTNLTLFTAIGIGPGIGLSKASRKLVEQVVENREIPLVVDADALNILSEKKSLLKKMRSETILTPHLKEFDRLFGIHEKQEQRVKKAIAIAKQYNCIIILKSAETVITSGRETVVNTTGNAGLAKGGSGDALTGMITAFLAQGYAPFTAARIAVYLHGLSADLALKNQSMESMLITDVIDFIGQGFKLLQK
jgi:hydroxyethylthiazole kinase-like uncharacterized protein yjeF